MKVRIATTLLLMAWIIAPYCAAAAGGPQSAKAYLTWQADTTAPAEYSGRVLPNQFSPITATLRVIENDQLVNLTDKEVLWYVNGNLASRGKGITTFTTPPEERAVMETEIRAVVYEYRPDERLSAAVRINRKDPFIRLHLPPAPLLRDSNIQVRALPYFFSNNPARPDLTWRVNGEIKSVIYNLLVLDTSGAKHNQKVLITVDGVSSGNPIERGLGEQTILIP